VQVKFPPAREMNSGGCGNIKHSSLVYGLGKSQSCPEHTGRIPGCRKNPDLPGRVLYRRQETSSMTIVLVLIFSIFFQLLAVVLALRLIPLSRGWGAWLLIAAAIVFRGFRLLLDLELFLFSGYQLHLGDQGIGLISSILIAAGVYRIGPLFVAFRQNITENEALLAAADQQRRLAEKRAEEAEEGRRILEALTEFIPEGIAIAGAGGGIRLVSRFGQQMVGRTLEDLQGSVPGKHAHTWGLYHLDGTTVSRDEDLPLMRALQKGETIKNEEWLIRRPDGGRITVLANAGPIRDNAGRITAGVMAWRDITERKQAAEQLRHAKENAEGSLARLEAVFRNMNEGMVITDLHGNIFQWNPSALKIHGLPEPPEGFGNITDFKPTYRLATLEGQPVEFEDWPICRAIGGGTFSNLEFQVRRLDTGEVKILSYNGSGIRDRSGSLTLALVTFRDVTAAKEVEKTIRESEARYRLLAESVPVGVFECEADGRCTYVNSWWVSLSGRGRSQQLGYGWLEAIHPEDRARILEEWKNAARRGDPWRCEYRVQKPEGQDIWVRVVTTAASFQDGIPGSFVGTIEDITEQKWIETTLLQAKEAAEEANRAKSEFLGNVSHEFRTPMTVIMAAIEHILGTNPEPEARPYLKMAQTSAESLLRLIEDILDLSKIEARKMEFDRTPFDPRQWVGDAVRMLSLKAEEKGLKLSLKIAPATPQILIGDPDRLRQVLFNLIENAIKFTDVGEVEVGMEPENGLGEQDKAVVRFFVRDTGIGIPKGKMDRLFRSFSQVDSSHTRRFGGTGLGLALSRRLVEGMGGRIWIESEEGKGSLFSFVLPFALPAEEKSGQPEPSEGEFHPASQPIPANILLAEDDPAVCHLIELSLRKRGWIVVGAADGEEALGRWEGETFDLILMDVQMPKMDGFTATRKIRERESRTGSHIPIVALTAHAREEDRRKCLEAGMDAFLAKPVRTEDLYAAVEGFLAGGHREKGRGGGRWESGEVEKQGDGDVG
jgi:PAS domain S-box-containing protein